MLLQFKRIFLITLLALLGLTALTCVGILMFTTSTSWRYMELVILIALLLGLLLLHALAAFAALEQGRWRILAATGLLAAALNVIIIPLYFCFAYHNYGTWNNTIHLINNLFVTNLIISSYLCLLPFVHLPKMKWLGTFAQAATMVMMTLSAILLLSLIWNLGDDSDLFRLFMICLILACGSGLSVFILYRFLGLKIPAELTALTQSVRLFCPRCLTLQEMLVGDSRCSHCKLKFKLEVEEPRCPKCHYILHGLTQPRCPECGELFNSEELAAPLSPLPPSPQSSFSSESIPPLIR